LIGRRSSLGKNINGEAFSKEECTEAFVKGSVVYSDGRRGARSM